MTSEQYRRVGEIYHGAMELAPEDRDEFLAGACGGDEELRREVESLLQAREQAGSYFGAPALEVAAGMLAQQKIPSLAGHRLSHYQVLSLIGAGGMGQVYLAEDTRLGRKVALKVLPPAFTGDRDRIRRFEQEAKAASALNQPNILTIHEIGEIDNCHFIVSEYVEGETLRQRIKNGEMTCSAALDISIQVASALAAAHVAGIIHRDIKPENVMARPDGLVKVLDFGLAKLTEERAGEQESGREEEGHRLSNPATTPLTDSGIVIGTPNYMSPEQARGLKVDARSDLFSLGVVLYEMIAGRAPFAGETPTDVIISIVQREPAPLAHYASEAPRELEQIVEKALRKDREERYQTATELLAELKGLRRRLELESLPGQARDAAATGARARGGFTARRAWLWAIATGLILLLTDGGLWLTRRTPEKASETPVIAVLPFKNLSDEKESDYFTDGLTNELIRNLSIIEGLEVRSRTSSFAFKGKLYNIREVGEKLKVNYVLGGTVLRSGRKLRIYAEFIKVSDDQPRWTRRFDRELKDIFEIQDEISLGIVNELRVNLGRGRRRYETNVEAYDLYLHADSQPILPDLPRLVWAEQISLYEQLIAKDPSFALAYAKLALVCAVESISFSVDDPEDAVAKSRVAAEKAIQLDPLLPEAHVALGWVRARGGQWMQAENSFREAIRLNPNRSETYTEYAWWMLMAVGRVEDALDQLRRAEKADPLSSGVKLHHGVALILARRYDEAETYFLRSEEYIEEARIPKDTQLARLRLGQGRGDEAIQILENLARQAGNPQVRGWLGYAYARSGRREEAEKMSAVSKSAIEQALIFAGLGAKDRALEALESMGSRGPQRLGIFLTSPEFVFLRGDVRLAALRKKIGLPDENSGK